MKKLFLSVLLGIMVFGGRGTVSHAFKMQEISSNGSKTVSTEQSVATTPAESTAPAKQSQGETTAPSSSKDSMGITINPDCMLGVGCKFDIQKTLGFKKDTGNQENTSVLMVIQDIILAATMFIGTVVTLAFIASGFLFILAGRQGNSGLKSKAIKGIT